LGLARAGFPRRLVTLMAIVLSLVAVATYRLFIWPELPPLPLRADAIIVLGGPGERDPTALALARAGRAPVLMRSVPDEKHTRRCLPPVPGVAIVCFYAQPDTTRGEAQYVGRVAQQKHWKSVILVTTADHAWRARLRVARCFPGAVYVSTTPWPSLPWAGAISYQWLATIKALVFERDC
jgi:uncharacterized SAM-binding protein YcdF (DUF218 family)